MPIDCSKCKGLCCRHVVTDLDRGDGTCKNFDETTFKCKIYEKRPLICNTDAMFERFYSKFMSRDQFDNMNKKACKMLQEASSRYLLNCRKGDDETCQCP